MITLLNCIAQSLGFSLTIYYLGITIEKNRLELIKVFLIVFISDIITFGNYEYLSIPLITLFMLIYPYKHTKSIVQNFIVALICIIIEYVTVIIIVSILLLVLPEKLEYYKSSVLYNLTCSFSVVATVFILKKQLHKFGLYVKSDIKFQKINGLIPSILLLNLICILFSILCFPFISSFKNEMITLLAYICLVFIFVIFSVSSVFIFSQSVKVETEKAEKSKELELALGFQKSVEKMYDDVMNFKHDYIKIYSTFQIFINNNDMVALREYFNENITPLQKQLDLQKFNVQSLVNIKDIALQGIIYTSILKADRLDIAISIDILQPVSNINMHIIDLSRIVGIFIDNAIEENINANNRYINICFLKKQKCIGIIIENSCVKNKNIANVLSTSNKGEERGRGLNIVKTLINKYDNIVNNTYIYDEKFVQELWIGSEDS